MFAALEVLVRENTAADDGQGRVGADKILRRKIDKIQKLGKRAAVQHHGSMFGVDGDAVLIEIGVRRILPKPRLSRKRQRHRAHIAAGSALPDVSHVLAAEHTLGIPRRNVSQLGGQAVVLFGLAQIDGNFNLVSRRLRNPEFIFTNSRKLDVIVFDAQLVKPVKRLVGTFVIFREKPSFHFGRTGGKHIEDFGGKKFLLALLDKSLFLGVGEDGQNYLVGTIQRGNSFFVRFVRREAVEAQLFDQPIGKIRRVRAFHAQM